MTTTFTPDQIADVLERAAARIERYGWVQGTRFGNEWVRGTPMWQARCCADGAIEVSSDFDLDGRLLGVKAPRVDLSSATLREFGAWLIDNRDAVPADRHLPHEGAIWKWNDADGRTAEEVVAALRECAADARTEARIRAGGEP